MRLVWLLYTVFFVLQIFFCTAQKFTEPSKLKRFNITVNEEEFTIKAQMLANAKEVKTRNESNYIWYANQKIIETAGGYSGKLIDGNYSVYYLNDQLKEQGYVKYGLKNSEWKYWYPNGKLKEIINWKNGRKNGAYLLYNDDGGLMASGHFKNDKLHGRFYTYGPNRKVADKKKYRHGNEVVRKVKQPKVKELAEEKPKAEKRKPEKKKRKENKEKETVSDETEKH